LITHFPSLTHFPSILARAGRLGVVTTVNATMNSTMNRMSAVTAISFTVTSIVGFIVADA
jgi:hypothetical protein